MLKRLALLALFLLLACGRADTFPHGFAVTGGQGGGQYLLTANVFSPPYGVAYSQRTLTRPAASTSDYYDLCGITFPRPYDLNAMGSWGQSIATTKGFRYFWILAPDHPNSASGFPLETGWGQDCEQVYIAYSNDPTILPDPSTFRPIIPSSGNRVVVPGTGGNTLFAGLFVPVFVYNPDDVTHRGYLYVEGADATGGALTNSLNMLLFRSDDLDTWAVNGISHAATGQFGFTSFQYVYRTGVNTWVSYGGGNKTANDGSLAKWTSTDGKTFTMGSTYGHTTASRDFPNLNEESPQTTISGDLYAITREDARSADGGMYVVQAPVNASTGALITTGPPIVRLSNKYDGVYPGPTYLAGVTGYEEDGIYFAYATHGFFADTGIVQGALYSDGGGLDQQYIDIYAIVTNATAAAVAAPTGVQVSVASGTATISWSIPVGLPTHSYNIYRSTAAGTKGTLVGNTSGASITDAPTASTSCTLYFYRIYKVDSGAIEQQFRTVSTFVSSSSAFINQHVTRACKAGVDFATIDRTWLDTVDAWLNSNSLQVNLMFWTDPAFGVKCTVATCVNGSVITKIFDLGTTRLPRGGDYTPFTSATTYAPTAFNSAVPGWVNANTNSFGYYGSGRFNQLRLKLGHTFLAAYTKSHTNLTTFLSRGEFANGLTLQHTSGSPGNAAFIIGGSGWSITSTRATTGTTAHIIGGTFDGTSSIAYAEGVAGTSAGPATDANPLWGQVGEAGEVYFLGSGSTSLKFTTVPQQLTTAGSYTFENAEAQYTGGAQVVFDGPLTPTQMSSFASLYRTRLGP